MSSYADHKSAHEIFTSFKDSELLFQIAEIKGIDTAEKSKKEVIQELTEHAKSQGLEILLKTLKVATVKVLASDLDWKEYPKNQPPNNRSHVVRKLCLHIGNKPEKFFKKRSLTELQDIVKHLGGEEAVVPETKNECVQSILDYAERMGLEHLFSAFSTEKLKEFCKSCSLKVETTSYDHAIDSLLKLENFLSKKEAKQPKKKPPIDENITESELMSHYLRDDLVVWLNDHSIPSDGPKAFLSKKIYNTLHNLPLPPKPATVNRRRKKSQQDQSKSEESEKSEEERSPKKMRKQEKEDEEEEEEEEKEKEKPAKKKMEEKEKEKEKERVEEEEEEEEKSPAKKGSKKKKEEESPKKSPKKKKVKDDSDNDDKDYSEEETKKKGESDSKKKDAKKEKGKKK